MKKLLSSLEMNHSERIEHEKERMECELKASGNKKAWLFMAADYSNLGDQAIAKATKEYFISQQNISLIEVPKTTQVDVIGFVRDHIQDDDIILISGGGFLGSLWFECEEAVREIVKAFPNNKIIVLPQSLYWGKDAKSDLQDSIAIYKNHANITFCARDKKTYRDMKKKYSFAPVLLLPDMVLSASCSLFTNDVRDRKGTLLVIRKDKESAMTEEDRETLRNWAAQSCPPVTEIENHAEGYKDVLAWERDGELNTLFIQFSQAELVITDRLHGMIFAALSGTPCVAIDSATHKIKNTYKWIRDIKNITVVKSANQVPRKAKKMLKVGSCNWDESKYQEILNKAFEELLRD